MRARREAPSDGRASGREPVLPRRDPTADQLRALQRSAGNQAVARLLQRTVVVGQPGPTNPKTTYDAAHAGNLVAALAGPIAGMPAWINGWLQPHLTTIEASAAAYEFDEVSQVAWWVVVRELAGDLLAYMRQPRVPANRGDVGDKTRIAYAAIEAQRAAYAAQGAINGQYQLFGLTYHLANQGANHYYAARPAGTNIEYHGLKRDSAKALVNHLLKAGPAAPYPGDARDVDDFVCAFLAEPTRWPEDQVFNVLALTRGGTDELTGSESAHSLPMAGGTTWDAALNELGRRLPMRALAHAEAEGLMVIVRQELAAAANWPAFLTAMRGQLDFN